MLVFYMHITLSHLNQTHVVNNLHICLNDAHMLHFIFIIATTNQNTILI